MEALEARYMLAADVYTWSPPQPLANISASNPQNWLKNGQAQGMDGTIPGTAATDQVVFDGSQTNGNANINWDNNFTFSSIALGPQGGADGTKYTGLHSISANDKVDLTGAGTGISLFTNVNSSKLNLNFAALAQVRIDATATITNMTLAGVQTGELFINGGTTTIARSGGYKDTIGVNFVVGPNGTLNDQSYNSLQFTNNNLQIGVVGTMIVYYGPTPGATLIDNNGFSNDYITESRKGKDTTSGGVYPRRPNTAGINPAARLNSAGINPAARPDWVSFLWLDSVT